MQQPEYDESEGEMMEDFRCTKKSNLEFVEYCGQLVCGCFANWMEGNMNCFNCSCRTICRRHTPYIGETGINTEFQVYGIRDGEVVDLRKSESDQKNGIINPEEQKEMSAVGYIKEQARMCNTYKTCEGCPISKANDGDDGCKRWIRNHPEEAVAIVQKWSEEHPEKTMLQDFFEKFPNAPKHKDGHPEICPWAVGYMASEKCPNSKNENGVVCLECWNRPLEVE